MSMHGTSAVTERNRGLWGHVCTSSRNSLGMNRAKQLTTFNFHSRAQNVSTNNFDLLLSVV